MRIRLILAVFFSVLLIAFAAWARLSSKTELGGKLVAVENAANSSYEDIYIDPSLGYSALNTDENLTKTDIISRQMFVDYLNLSAAGGDNSANLNALANKYIDSIPSLQVGLYTPFSLSDIKTIPNATVNFKAYETAINQIHEKFGSKMEGVGLKNTNLNSSDPETYLFLENLSGLYLEMAGELKKISVPIALAPSHLRLLNNYLSISGGMKAISETKKDPATAVAGMITVKESTDEQEDIITEINQILAKNGI
ncbi:MAG: hypothetical protein AAB690_02715 [Patescibacteria group bacterium]